MELLQTLVLIIIVLLIVSLYKGFLNPSLTFFIAALALLLIGAITPSDLLKGLSNEQIILIFLLMLVTAGIRAIYGGDLFSSLFNVKLTPKRFLMRMMLFVSSISAFLNNTPIVAFMIPYVKDWADRTGNPASKFLMPLSFATILGGMITVIGTSANLVLNGLIQQYNLPLLTFTDFLFLGIMVTIAGWIYLYFIGFNLLPKHEDQIEALRQNVKEYIVETEVFTGSKLIGKTIKEAGLRNLKDVFLIEILRNDEVISPVSPEMELQENDFLFFSGNKQSIYKLIKEDNGLQIPKQRDLGTEGEFNFAEAVVPANSELIGRRIKDSDFRRRYNASIIAIHRDGKLVSGKVGEMKLNGGDFLLLLSDGQEWSSTKQSDLFFISVPTRLNSKKSVMQHWFGILSILLLISGIVGLFPLFSVSLALVAAMVMVRVLNISELKTEIDLSLLMVLVASLAIGTALEKTGTALLIANALISVSKGFGPVAVLTSLFVVTTLLTAFITNTATIALVFPIAMSVAAQMHLDYAPFFVATAFAASGDFMTPFGYQCNLMVYGPGGYSFKDFFKVGFPFTVLYTVICVSFISTYYHL
ncbi:MAG TPA: SLC13 family permease [Cytophagales bacterium]|nr:SLC13 family permease [Cytophagales bacterium]